jgi:hypothetical protein
MKPEVMLELLEGACDQLGVKVTYEPLQGATFRGGLCKVKGAFRVIVDKRASDEERVATLAAALGKFDTAEIALPQPARELIALHQGSGPRRAA